MAYANTKVGMEINHPKNILNLTLSDDDEEDKKQLKSTNTRPKKVIAEKKVKKPKISRNRAKSEDRQTQIEDKVEVKSRRKQDKVESAVSPMVKVTKKKILRSNSVDRLAYEKPITIDVKNKNKNKPTITGESSKPPQRRALKNKEELPLKPKRTKKNILNSEENVPVISPPDKLKIKGTKKKQVFIDKEAVNLDTLQELPNQTAKTEMASKKSKSPTNKIKIVLEGDVKAPKEINKPDEN